MSSNKVINKAYDCSYVVFVYFEFYKKWKAQQK